LLKNKKDCTDVYCVTLTELQAHCDAFIQNFKIVNTTIFQLYFGKYDYADYYWNIGLLNLLL